MSSFLSMKGLRAELGRSSNTHHNDSKLGNHKDTRSRTVSSKAGAGKPAAGSPFKTAAQQGLFAPERKHERSKARSSKHAQELREADEEEHPDDPVIKGSMYPQVNGRRRSEIMAQHAALASRRGNTKQNGRHSRRQEASADMQRRSWDSGSSFQSRWEDNVEARPVRVEMYPAKYIKEPVKTSAQPSKTPTQSLLSKKPSIRTIDSRTSLPGDEYRQLKRRQEMQRAREVLELHFAGRHNAQSVPIWHGMKQGFTVRNSERRRISKMQFAVRKAVCAKLDILEDKFMSAMHSRADKVHFSAMTDVDGVPIDEHMMYEFIRLYQKAPDADYVPTSPVHPPHRRTWIDERNKRFVQQAKQARRQAEAVETVVNPAPTKPHVLVSKFSWDDNDSDSEAPKRLKKLNR